jgi:SAM-dependent methyltransferase
VRPGEQILDLGCGNGWATRLLAKQAPGCGAIGVDISPAMVARAEALHSLTIRARYEVAPFEKLPFGEKKFDRAFSMEALYYAVDLDLALGELARVLKADGKVDVVVDYYKESPATAIWAQKTGVPMHWLSIEEWRGAFERAGFASIASQRVFDSRGAGEAKAFVPDRCEPDFETKRRIHEAGSLWIHAERPR